MKTLVTLLLLIVAASAPEATAQHVRALLPEDTLQIGERFSLRLVARYPEHLDLILPQPTPDGPAVLGDFEILRLVDRSISYDSHPFVVDTIVFEAATFSLDTARLADATMLFAGPSDTVSASILPVSTPVRSSVNEGDAPRDVAPPVDIPRVWWPWLLGGLLGAAIAITLIGYWRRRRSRDTLKEDSLASLSPLDESLVRLDRLETSAASTPTEQKEFAVELSDILRTYLSRRLRLAAREQTTREILDDLRVHGFGADDIEQARHVLEMSDYVKFARRDTSILLLREAAASTRAWIEALDEKLDRQFSTVENAHPTAKT